MYHCCTSYPRRHRHALQCAIRVKKSCREQLTSSCPWQAHRSISACLCLSSTLHGPWRAARSSASSLSSRRKAFKKAAKKSDTASMSFWPLCARTSRRWEVSFVSAFTVTLTRADVALSPLAGSTSAALEALLEHPSTCLPVHQRSTANQFKHMGHGFARILNPADPNGAPFYAPARGIQSKSTGGTFASPPQQAANPDRAMTMDELSSRMTGADPTDLSSLGNGGDTLDYDTLMMLQSTDFGDGQRILEMGDAASMHGVSRSETRGPDERRGA